MNRRTVAGLLALALVLGLTVLAARAPSNYVTFRPGPTMNVLGKYEGEQIIRINGHRSYPDDGSLQMTTVYPSGPEQHVSIGNVIRTWLDASAAVLPRDAVYEKDETLETVRDESAADMLSSQDAAKAAALDAFGEPARSRMQVGSVDEGGPSHGLLADGDLIVSVDGVATDDPDTLLAQIKPKPPGTRLRIVIDRGGEERIVRLRTIESPDDPEQSRIGVGIKQTFEFPFDVDIQLPDSVGGPSAGIMFALGIYDLLTPGSLTGGRPIAGTGTIGADGVVGPIGGLPQKIAGAQRAGARLFLVPAANCREALGATYDHDRIKVVRVTTLKDAIEDVEAWSNDPDVELPRCG